MALRWLWVLALGLLSAQAAAGEPADLKTQNDRLSYAIGVDAGRSLKRQGPEVDPDRTAKGLEDVLLDRGLSLTEEELRKVMTAFHVERVWRPGRAPENVSYGIGVGIARSLKWYGFKVEPGFSTGGLKDALLGRNLAMTEEELRAAMAPVAAKLRQTRMTARRLSPEQSRKERDFLSENLKKEGVVALPSGLQYRVLKAGEGRKPADADTVEVRYRGTFIDGTEFGASPPEGQPAAFKVAAAIPGWKEALKRMSEGSQWRLFIPPRLVYRAGGWGLAAEANSTLVFDLELLAVK